MSSSSSILHAAVASGSGGSGGGGGGGSGVGGRPHHHHLSLCVAMEFVPHALEAVAHRTPDPVGVVRGVAAALAQVHAAGRGVTRRHCLTRTSARHR